MDALLMHLNFYSIFAIVLIAHAHVNMNCSFSSVLSTRYSPEKSAISFSFLLSWT